MEHNQVTFEADAANIRRRRSSLRHEQHRQIIHTMVLFIASLAVSFVVFCCRAPPGEMRQTEYRQEKHQETRPKRK